MIVAGAVLAGCATQTRTGPATAGEAGLFKAQIGDISGGVRPGPHAFWYVQQHPAFLRVGMATWRPEGQAHGSALSRWVSKILHHGPAAPATAIAGRASGLPVPSIIEVTNLSTGATVEARVDDRGPADGALISLSPDLAQPLGGELGKPLLVRVRYKAPVIAWREQPSLQYAMRGRIAPVPPASRPPAAVLAAQTRPVPAPTPAPAPATLIKTNLPAPVSPAAKALPPPPQQQPVAVVAPVLRAEKAPEATSGHVFRVQAGAFASLDNAHRAVGMVAQAGSAQIEPIKRGARTLYRVIVEGRPNESGATLRAKVAKSGFADARVLPS